METDFFQVMIPKMCAISRTLSGIHASSAFMRKIPRAHRAGVVFSTHLFIIGIVFVLFLEYVCHPGYLKETSMNPTYTAPGLIFYSPFSLSLSDLKRGDVVVVRSKSSNKLLLRRIVALEGELVDFRDGVLYINGEPLDEPYVKMPCSWNVRRRLVSKGKVYVVGDNRSMEKEKQQFGEISTAYLQGKVLW